MRLPDAAPATGHVAAGMFHGPARLRQLMRVLRRLPAPVAESVLAALAVGDALIRMRRMRQASAWAAAQGATGWARWRMAFALLANHGRFVAEEAMMGAWSPEDLRPDVTLEGAEHLHALPAGAMLLGLHLGPPRAWFILRALGYPVRFAGRLETAQHDPRWEDAFETGEVVHLPSGEASGRLPGLYRVRNLLRDGALIYLTADGPFGREAFRIELPGGPLIVRIGWLALRQQTRVPTLPVLMHREGRRRVIVVHPPLPDPDGDPVRDAAICQAALTPIVESYIRRFPTQCRYIALPRWPTSPSRALSAPPNRPSRWA